MDHTIRRLQRAAAAGDPAAREAVLRERLRAGRLTPARLDLAAWLGDPVAARLAAGGARDPERDPVAWCRRVGRSGRGAAVRASLAAGRAALPRWRETFPDWEGPERALDAAASWLAAPGLDAAAEAHRRGSEAAHEAALALEAGEPACALRARCALCAASLAAQGSKRLPRRLVRDLAPLLADAPEAWRAAREELVAWALGDRGR